MSNICTYIPSPAIASVTRLNHEFALIHKHLCYLEGFVASTVYKSGTAAFTADGVKTNLVIPHGLGANPRVVLLSNRQPLNSDTLNRTITTDATNITVTYGNAPIAGENAFYDWVVLL